MMSYNEAMLLECKVLPVPFTLKFSCNPSSWTMMAKSPTLQFAIFFPLFSQFTYVGLAIRNNSALLQPAM